MSNDDDMRFTVLGNQHRGSSLRLTFSITNRWSGDVCRTVVTDIYNLDCALIRLKFEQEFDHKTEEASPVCSMISTKLTANPFLNCKRLPFALTKDHSIQMIIKSESGNLETNINTADWSDWCTIGKTTGKIVDKVLTVNPIDILMVINKRAVVSFANLYDDDELTDFYLGTPTDKIAVHKTCLAAHSDVFKAMLSKEWKETAEGQLNIPGATLKTLECLKKYIYLGSLPDDDDGLQQLLVFASCYMMEALKTECISKLTFQATSVNLHNILRFACENNVPDIVIAILEQTPNEVIKEAYNKINKALEEYKPDSQEVSDGGNEAEDEEGPE